MQNLKKALTIAMMGMALFPITNHAQSWLTNGLVAYYPFNGNANDAAGTNHGTVNGAVPSTNRFGEANRAYYFDGQSRIQASDAMLPMGNTSRTIAFWLNSQSTKLNSLPLKYGNNSTSTGNWINILGDRRVLFDFYNSGVFSTNLITLNTWQHLVCTLKGPSAGRIYINGQLAGVGSVNANTTISGVLLIGNSVQPSDDGVIGGIDDVRVYDRALSAAEIRKLYEHESQTPPEGAFRIVYGQFSWPEAKTDAETRGGHLATFRNSAEWNAAQSLISQFGQGVWLGGYQPVGSSEPAGNWSWVTGEPWTFSAWQSGEPNQSQGINEDALMVWSAWAGWNDAPSSAKLWYVLEFEPELRVDLIKAVKPSFGDLVLGHNYQLQLSGDLNTWTNHGAAFNATNASMVYPQYWDVDNWGSLFFRLQVVP